MEEKIKNIALDMVRVRHELHRNPELSFKETETCNKILDTLNKHNIYCEKIANTGVLAVIDNNAESCILLRADIDGLPIVEDNTLAYKSLNGAMHACGHDIHTAVLLGTLIHLSQNKGSISHNIVAIFQPGEEESPGGASIILKSKKLDEYNIKKAFALHTAHDMKVGKIGIKSGEYMAATSEMHFKVYGNGGHAALSSGENNPIINASKLILSLNEIEKEYSGSIVRVGKVFANGATNIIPDEVSIAGTIRALTIEKREKIKNKIRTEAERISNNIEIEFGDGYPPVYNDIDLSLESIDKLRDEFGDEYLILLNTRMTADDFGFFAEKYPSFYYRLGVQGDWAYAALPHTPKFLASDDAIYYGIKSMLCLLK